MQPRDPTAVMPRRFLAWIIDVAILFAVSSALWGAFAVGYDNVRDVAQPCDALEAAGVDVGSCIGVGDTVWVTDGGESATITLVVAGYLALTLVLMQGLVGATPGKVLTGIRVVGEDGRRPTPGSSVVRSLLLIVDVAPWIVPLVGPITALTTVGHRRVGDMAAKTYVIRRADAGAPVVLPGGVAGPGIAPPPFDPSAVPAPTPASGADEAQWDEARGAWITWDAARGAWLEWDAATSTWGPIST